MVGGGLFDVGAFFRGCMESKGYLKAYVPGWFYGFLGAV